MVDALGSLALVPEADGLLGREVHHDETVGACLSRVPNCLFFAIGEQGVVIACAGEQQDGLGWVYSPMSKRGIVRPAWRACLT